MRFVTLRELKINPSKVLDRLAKDDLVVTRSGKPAAALLYLDEELLEEFILARHPRLLKEVEAARAEFRKKGGLGHDAMRGRVQRRRRSMVLELLEDRALASAASARRRGLPRRHALSHKKVWGRKAKLRG